MQRKHLIIVAIAVIFLAVVGCLLAWNTQTAINQTVNQQNNTIQNNVSNGTVSSNNSTNDTVGNDTGGWVWSEQQGDYIKQFTDMNGDEHTIFKSTGNELVFMKDGSVFMNGINITDEWNMDFS